MKKMIKYLYNLIIITFNNNYCKGEIIYARKKDQ